MMPEKTWFDILVNAPWMGTILGIICGGLVSYAIAHQKNKSEFKRMLVELDRKDELRKKEVLFSEKKTAYVRFMNLAAPQNNDINKINEYVPALSCVEIFGSDEVREISMKIGRTFVEMRKPNTPDKQRECENNFWLYLRELNNAIAKDLREHA